MAVVVEKGFSDWRIEEISGTLRNAGGSYGGK